MKLVKSEEMKEIDRQASQDYSVSSLILMENAGLQVLATIRDLIGGLDQTRITILAGSGNNGGDGLVLARHLHNAGAKVDTFLLGESAQMTVDTKANYRILEKMAAPIFPLQNELDMERLLSSLLATDLIVDAIYGIGFRGRLNDFETRVVGSVNLCQVPVVAVDMPSGVEADTGQVNGMAVQASHTVTLALPKVGLVLEPGRSHAGQVTIADISIPRQLLEDERLKLNLIDAAMIRKCIKPRQDESHKGTYGHALVVGGSMGMTGAVMMTAYAALRSGAGLVTAALPESLVPIFETAIQEVMSFPLAETSAAAIALEAMPALEHLLGTVSVCAIGPGMSRYQEANRILRFVLENSGVPILIDADGLNALEGDAAILKDLQVPIVITPHPGEMARLTGLTLEEIQHNRLGIAGQFATAWGITVVLKGHNTIVASPAGELFINTNGNPGMATAGSGDVLSGIIIGLMAQGLRAVSAAVAGVYIHGRCGDQAARLTGQRGLVAGDLIEYLPGVLSEIENGH